MFGSRGKSEDEARALTASFSPPNLIGEGAKVQTDWLFRFLHTPETIRPWLQVRMPTFDFVDSQRNTLVKYFSYLDDQEFPFQSLGREELSGKRYEAAQRLFSDDYFSCGSCHIVGDKLPSGSSDSWAPNFAMAKKRLKPDWIIEWIKNPQALMPGTKMPTYFDPEYFDEMGPDDVLEGDEHEQIRALRDFILTIPDTSDVSSPIP